MFDMIKSFYDQGFYTEKDLDLFVSVQWITQDQENEILGKQNQETGTPSVTANN